MTSPIQNSRSFPFISKHYLSVIIVLISLQNFAQTTYNIDDPEKLRDVIYEPGDVIILKNGTYTTDEKIQFLGSGTAENPVTFRAETPGGVVFTGGPRLTIGGESENGAKIATGEYLVVDGFHWKGGYGASNFIEFRNGQDFAHHSTIQNCVIDGLGIEPTELAEDLANEQITKHRWIVLYGTYNTVINCSFMNKVSSGAIILGEYSYNAFPEVADGEPEVNNSCEEVGHTITKNYFYNFQKMEDLYGRKANGDQLSNAGDSETIRIGTSSYQMVNSNVTISNNYFVQSDGENEIITNKSKGNIITNNTFRRCRGSLVLRHGSYATVDGNIFLGENVDGTGGIRITDSHHTITNNYIQDCITVQDQAKWNNGITFIGGSANADVSCTSDNVSNGYQKSENINVSNNTFVNTNAPLFYNTDKGSTDPTGTVNNNLIYFDAGNTNLSDIISGDTNTSYTDLGTTLSYSGNVFTGTNLGVINNGFSEENGIIATENGEMFTFSGSSSTNKGANLGTYIATTDAMVGYGIGACFTNNLGESITDGDCTIEISENLTISSLETFAASASSKDVNVTANVSWTAVSNNDWITISTTSGTGNATVTVNITENSETTSRSGSVTFSQVAGGDDIVRTLNVNQEGANLTDLYTLINAGTNGAPVTIHSYSKQQDTGGKTNFATNALDKNFSTQWTADDGDILSGDYKGDGEFVIFDLSDEYQLDLIQIATDDKSDPYGLQIWVSTSGIDASDFTKLLPTSNDLLITTTTGTRTDFDTYQVSENARYVKLIGFGRYNTDGNSRKSVWTNITEVEFYGESTSLSADSFQENSISMYPNPAKTLVTIKAKVDIKTIQVFSLDGKEILSKNVNDSKNEIILNTSKISNGIYLVRFTNESGLNEPRLINIAH
ncbi:chondroitinase-B domain-containing protein [Polaribacter sp. MED152]|uniref:chondroitinase-B domain-containing protein n=1 Tax=Polaribacter sp. MED152 TaxID=313598 RepID=UPI000068CBC5|nr:chondroitinase-B domain-containing protein [Polaribacter sp. MED152]EAQ41795.1 alginate lyase precursor [Polaribacter sp. MED152]